MKIDNNTIIFKSTPDNFYKEREGLKNYTIRRISLWSEMKEFEDFYERYVFDLNAIVVSSDNEYACSFHHVDYKIKIINSITREEFTRTISDISEFEGIWIISWRGSD